MSLAPTGSLDAHKIFEHAGKFQWTYEHLQNFDHVSLEEMKAYAADPGLILSALASELYLKCLLAIFSVPRHQFGHVHDLHELFKKLPPEIQDRVSALWDHDVWQQSKRDFLGDLEGTVKENIPRHLAALLHFGANTFVDLRYVYEKPRNINNIIVELPSILRKVILEIQPDWNR
jgi:hypothetical protein